MMDTKDNTLAKASWIAGLKDSRPLCVVFLFVGISLGALCHESGFGALQAAAQNALIYAGPLQILIIDLAHKNDMMLNIVVATLVINFRFILMSMSLAPYFKHKSVRSILLALPMLASSSFTVTYIKCKTTHNMDLFTYYLGVAIPSYAVSILACVLGYYISDFYHSSTFTDIIIMIMPLYLLVLTAKRWPQRAPVFATIAGFLLMPFGEMLFHKMALLIVPFIIGGTVYVIAFFRRRR